MSKRHGRRGPGPQAAQGQSQGAPGTPGQEPRAAQSQARHGGHGQSHGPQRERGGQPQANKPPSWGAVRDAVRRDVEVASQSLAFLERFGEGLDGQRRLFIDFPRITEELRTASMERLASSLERLYEGAPGGFELTRFLRDLPLALGHLAAAEAAARRQHAPAQSGKIGKEGKPADAAESRPPEALTPEAKAVESAIRAEISEGAPAPEGALDPALAFSEATTAESAPVAVDDAPAMIDDAPAPVDDAPAVIAEAPAGRDAPAPVVVDAAPSPAEPVAAPAAATPISPRVELRTKLLAAAPLLTKAAQAFKRNTATVRRAAGPRRAIGPWRSDREVLEQARRAVEFVYKVYDAYANGWNDAHLSSSAGGDAAAEMDRFLAWTQLSRYAEVARAQAPLQSTPRGHEAAPGVISDKPASESAPVEKAHEIAPVEDAPVPVELQGGPREQRDDLMHLLRVSRSAARLAATARGARAA